jgi:hypothetical protein
MLLRAELAPVAFRTVWDQLWRLVVRDLQPPAFLFDEPLPLALNAFELLANGHCVRSVYDAIIARRSGICLGPVEVVGPVENLVAAVGSCFPECRSVGRIGYPSTQPLPVFQPSG